MNARHRQFVRRAGALDAAGRHAAPRGRHTARRGMLLLVVLVIIAVMALIAASFAYRMQGEQLGIEALGDLQQARMAVDSGIALVQYTLRDERIDMDKWYDNPDRFWRMPVWMPDSEGGIGGTETANRKQIVPGEPAWRFSVVATEQMDENRVHTRWGLTDESSKLNINVATRGELMRLVKTLTLEETPPEALVDCLIDWRDKNDEQNSPAGAESPWYMAKLKYGCKNAPFDSIEELLMVKNWNGFFLFGEDANRNGRLDENEDDGRDGQYPNDNGDGKLDRGLEPYLTVYSLDYNLANDNRGRLNINTFPWSKLTTGDVPTQLEYLQKELGDELIQFLAEAQKRKFKFRSIGELWNLQVYEDGSSNWDDARDTYDAQVKEENAAPKSDEENTGDVGDGSGTNDNADNGNNDNGNDNTNNDSGNDSSGNDSGMDNNSRDDSGNSRDSGSNSNDNTEDDENGTGSSKSKDRTNKMVAQDAGGRDRDNGGTSGGSGRGSGRSNLGTGGGRTGGRTGGRADDNRDNNGDNNRGNGRSSGRSGNNGGNANNSTGNNSDNSDTGNSNTGSNTGDGNTGESDADREARKGTPVSIQLTPEQMDAAMDRLSVKQGGAELKGLINVNTASEQVLQSIIGVTEEEAKSIVSRRRSMQGPSKLTPAWVVTSGALSPEKFAMISNKLTTRSLQYTADVIGFADHVGTFRRVQAVIEMRGHIAQLRYYRDISSLGCGYDVWKDKRDDGDSEQ